MVKEIFVYAANSNEIDPLLRRDSVDIEKRVQHLYADVFALSHIIADSKNVKEKTITCMMDREGYKTLFLLREGKLCFCEEYSVKRKRIDQFDMTNVNMTVNYARQTLREHPEELIVVGATQDQASIVEGLTLPASFFHYPSTVMVAEADAIDFVIPIAGLFLGKESDKESLLPKVYQREVIQERILRYASAVFIIVSFICLGYIISALNQARQIGAMIDPLKAEIGIKAKVFEEFESRNREFHLPSIHQLSEWRGQQHLTFTEVPVALQTLNREK